MSAARIRAIILGLAAIERTAHEARERRVDVSADLRSILALLATWGNGDPRPYADLIIALEAERVGPAISNINVGRSNDIGSARIAILDDLGIDLCSTLIQEVNLAQRYGRVKIQPTICAHYRIETDQAALIERYGIEHLSELHARPANDIRQRCPAWIVYKLGEQRALQTAMWGFVRQLTGRRGGLIQAPVVNLRDPTAATWLPPVGNQFTRCLVPFDAFTAVSSRKGGADEPQRWLSVPSVRVASFGGIWRPTERGVEFALLMCEPNVLAGSLNRKSMPVIIAPEDEARWLDTPQWAHVADLISPFPSQLMRLI